MDRKSLFFVLLAGVVPVALYLIAGRPLSELAGYAQASADVTIDTMQGELPREVHERKRRHELGRIRRDLLERQVQLTKSNHRINELRRDVAELQESLERRRRLLADAQPALQRAVTEKLSQVEFGGECRLLAEFERDIDDLLARQERDEQQLGLKQQGLARLETSVGEAEAGLREMRQAVEATEQEIELLVARREQAEIESQTLRMISTIAGGVASTGEDVGSSLAHLRDEVASLEARNEAERAIAPPTAHGKSNRVSRQWNRLEVLREIHDASALKTKGAEQVSGAGPAVANGSVEDRGGEDRASGGTLGREQSLAGPAAAEATTRPGKPAADKTPVGNQPADDRAAVGGVDVRIEIRGT